MISRLRSLIAMTLAILVTVLTFGLVEVNRTGGPGGATDRTIRPGRAWRSCARGRGERGGASAARQR